jgi:hypothetical protein
LGVSAVDFIKIDVDGNELGVLRGAESLMREQRPTLFLELAPYEYRNPGDFEAVLEIRGSGTMDCAPEPGPLHCLETPSSCAHAYRPLEASM